MVEKRKGNQYPTQSHTIEYNRSKGQEAIDLYNSTGRTAQEWQELLLYDILAINDEDLYVHKKEGIQQRHLCPLLEFLSIIVY